MRINRRAKLYYSPLALRDLEDIRNYINDELTNPAAALNTVNTILDKLGRLRVFLETGSPLGAVITIETDYRFLVCGNYLAFYRSRGEDVYIDRIIYGRRDYVKILFGEQPEEDS